MTDPHSEKALTARQKEIFVYLRDEIDRRGVPPTIREIGERFQIRSTKGVEDHLAALSKKGFIRRERGKSRAIEIEGRPDLRGARSLPLLGRIAAGNPMLAVETHEDHVVMDESLVGGGDLFLLRVTGDSMKNAAILDGDMVVVRQQPMARLGEIVACRIGDEATVKRFHRMGEDVVLMPENDAHEPIVVPAGSDFQILGKVVGVYRKL
jgi:repressor LexA